MIPMCLKNKSTCFESYRSEWILSLDYVMTLKQTTFDWNISEPRGKDDFTSIRGNSSLISLVIHEFAFGFVLLSSCLVTTLFAFLLVDFLYIAYQQS